mgnify:CR=1 FL=1
MNCIRYIFVCLIISFAVCSQEPSAGVQLKDQKAIQKDIDSISDLSPENYSNQIDNYRESIEKFLGAKKKVCQGEYAPYILTAPTEGKLPTKTKIDEKEKRSCFKELRKMHSSYLENMYKARKRFFEANYRNRLDELSRHHEKALKDLDALYPH